jgi:hypothetical protein
MIYPNKRVHNGRKSVMINTQDEQKPKSLEERVKVAIGVIAGIAVILYAVRFTVASASLMSWGIIECITVY